MMNGRLPRVMVGLLLLLVLAAPMLALADWSVTARISYTIENTSGTVIMEALDGAPAPGTARYDDASEGAFEITLTEPGNYLYRVYQQAGTLLSVYYDPIVYDVGIYVYADDDGNLKYSMVLSTEEHDQKPDHIVFRNTRWPDEPTTVRVTKKAYRGAQQVTEVLAGDVITYAITVLNTGDSTAYNVHITDTLPTQTPQLTLNEILDDGRLSEDGRTIAWQILRIMAGESATVRFTVTVPLATDDTTWHNTAEVTFETPADPNASWPVASADISEHMPRMTIRKEQSVNGAPSTADRVYVKPGDQITYFVTVSNVGDSLARNVTVEDQLPPALMLDASSISHGGYEEDGVITWALGELAQSDSVTVSFKATVPDATRRTTWVNQAQGSYTNATAIRTRAESGDDVNLIFFDMETVEVEAVYDPDATFTPSPGGTEAAPTPSPSGNITPPKTGDESQMALWLALMAISFVGIGMVLILLRRKDGNKK